MVTATDLISEIAEAEASGLAPTELAELRGQVEGGAAIAGTGISYAIPDENKGAWMPAWRISIDHAGVERGSLVPLPKDRLGYYLAKKRPIDGGRLFTMKMPELLESPGVFPCFVVPNLCNSKYPSKGDLLDHMEAAHPRESSHYPQQIKMIRDSMMSDNSALQSIVEMITSTPDPDAVAVPEAVRQAYDETVAHVQVSPGIVETLTIPGVTCAMCNWEPKAGSKRPDTALRMHIHAAHKEVTDGT